MRVKVDTENYYLKTAKIKEEKGISEEFLKSIGWFKLIRIRNFSILIQHIYQTLYNRKTYAPVIDEFVRKYFNYKIGQDKLFFSIYNLALRKVHKSLRDGMSPILQIFDFDNTITRFPHDSDDLDDPLNIQRLLRKGITSLFWGKENYYPSNLPVHRWIVSASGDIEGIRRYLEKRNLTKYFSKIFAMGGEKYKALKLLQIRQITPYDFILYYDDSLEFAIGSLFLCFIPFWITPSLQITKIDTDGVMTLDFYLNKLTKTELFCSNYKKELKKYEPTIVNS